MITAYSEIGNPAVRMTIQYELTTNSIEVKKIQMKYISKTDSVKSASGEPARIHHCISGWAENSSLSPRTPVTWIDGKAVCPAFYIAGSNKADVGYNVYPNPKDGMGYGYDKVAWGTYGYASFKETGLSENTDYTLAIWLRGTTYNINGSWFTFGFRTPGTPSVSQPTIVSQARNSITVTRGNVDWKGGSPSSYVTELLNASGTTISSWNSMNETSHTFTGLTSNMVYFVRTYASNGYATGYSGKTKTSTTCNAPTYTTPQFTAVRNSSSYDCTLKYTVTYDNTLYENREMTSSYYTTRDGKTHNIEWSSNTGANAIWTASLPPNVNVTWTIIEKDSKSQTTSISGSIRTPFKATEVKWDNLTQGTDENQGKTISANLIFNKDLNIQINNIDKCYISSKEGDAQIYTITDDSDEKMQYSKNMTFNGLEPDTKYTLICNDYQINLGPDSDPTIYSDAAQYPAASIDFITSLTKATAKLSYVELRQNEDEGEGDTNKWRVTLICLLDNEGSNKGHIKYSYYYSTDGTTWKSTSNSLNLDANSYTFNILDATTTYYFKVHVVRTPDNYSEQDIIDTVLSNISTGESKPKIPVYFYNGTTWLKHKEKNSDIDTYTDIWVYKNGSWEKVTEAWFRQYDNWYR